jgi:SWI/SNF-related matrix-associated actin-dependent regulator 1 of chromatin subfamily A
MEITKPRKYQRIGAKRIERFGGRALLADEMGLGKSLQALLYAYRNPEVRPIVIVCPAHLKYHWKREARIHFGIRASVLEGRKIPKRISFLNREQVFIINYDILRPWVKYLKALKPELIIIDECHYIKSPTAQRTKMVRALCRGVKRVVALSGTPLTNRPSELWTVLNILKKKKYPQFLPFALRYCEKKRTPWGWQFGRAKKKRILELHETLKEDLMIRRLKADVIQDLPQKNRVLVPITLSKQEMKEYTEALNDFSGWLRKNGVKNIKRIMRAEALAKIGYLKRLVAKMKLKYVLNWVDQYFEESDDKLILFSFHKSIIREIQERYHGISVKVDGSLTSKQKHRAFEEFNIKDKTKILNGQINAAGTGWSAKSTSTVGVVEFVWTPAEHAQAEDRVHGIGRGKEGKGAFYYYFVTQGTIEERICELIQEKQKDLDGILDGKTTEGSINIFDQLIKEIAGGKTKN